MKRRLAISIVIVLGLAGAGWLWWSPATARRAIVQSAQRLGGRATTSKPARQRRGGMELFFLVTADTHFGHHGMADVNKAAIAAMNTIEGRVLPGGVGGIVGKPQGLLAAGDLTEDGREEQWAEFVEHYGSDGTDGLLTFPVYETWGNHDKNSGWYVRRRIEERHGGVNYSWDWHDLHVVCLGEAPDHEAIAWLQKDLAAAGPDIGVVVYFHFPFEGPFSNTWFTAEYKDALHEALEGYRVLGIFHGHFHAAGHYRWRGHDVYNVGSAKHGYRSFAVVRVSDGRMTVASWNYQRKIWWWWHDKPIFGVPGPTRRHVPPGLVGG